MTEANCMKSHLMSGTSEDPTLTSYQSHEYSFNTLQAARRGYRVSQTAVLTIVMSR
jgi:hypothetical protein